MTRILVVDDTAVVREPIAAILANAGYETECAASAMEMLAKMRVTAPDLELLDLSMPHMDGMTALRVMRHDPTLAGTPVILLTASGDKANILAAAELGVRDYLLKSNFNVTELLGRVRKYAPLNCAKSA